MTREERNTYLCEQAKQTLNEDREREREARYWREAYERLEKENETLTRRCERYRKLLTERREA